MAVAVPVVELTACFSNLVDILEDCAKSKCHLNCLKTFAELLGRVEYRDLDLRLFLNVNLIVHMKNANSRQRLLEIFVLFWHPVDLDSFESQVFAAVYENIEYFKLVFSLKRQADDVYIGIQLWTPASKGLIRMLYELTKIEFMPVPGWHIRIKFPNMDTKSTLSQSLSVSLR